VIVRQGRGYAVRLPVDAVDAWRFEQLLAPVNDDAERVRRLTEALALWRGTPLAEYAHLGWA
jgi:two-component SAPR family response regulator